HLKDPRARAVIEAAAQRAGWMPKARGDGTRGRGFAFARYKNLACYCAIAADVTVDRKSGKVRVTRAVAAVDVGQVVNPDGVVNQIEGGLIQSASWTLKEALRFDRTRVTTRSWADYPILRFEEVPQVEVVILNQPNERFLGVGEGAQGPAAAALALPMSPMRGRARKMNTCTTSFGDAPAAFSVSMMPSMVCRVCASRSLGRCFRICSRLCG